MADQTLNAVVTLRNEVSPWLMILQVVPDGWDFPDYVPGQRAYYATRILLQKGFKARNLAGGMLSRVHTSFFLQEETEWVALSEKDAPEFQQIQIFYSSSKGETTNAY